MASNSTDSLCDEKTFLEPNTSDESDSSIGALGSPNPDDSLKSSFERSYFVPTSSPPPLPPFKHFANRYSSVLSGSLPNSPSSSSPDSFFGNSPKQSNNTVRTALSASTAENAADPGSEEGAFPFASVEDYSPMSYSPGSPSQGGNNGNIYHFKILVPSTAAGAIIGKGGETIGQLQRETNTRVKMSKASDFYPSTNERVCLISGSREGILKINDFVMDKIREKPDPNAKVAIDFDNKQPAERDKQVKVLVPNSTAGMIIGKQGLYIEKIKRETGAYVQISQKSTEHALLERCITIIGDVEPARQACAKILDKIMDDPQSGSCLNVSYADVQGPVANFNPTGSPYANLPCSNSSGTVNGPLGSVSGNGQLVAGSNSGGHNAGPGNGNANPGAIVNSQANNSNPNYASNGSLNSVSPANMNNFTNGGPGGINASLNLMPIHPGFSPPSPQFLSQMEQLKNFFRHLGFTDPLIGELCNASATLVTYNMLTLAANFCAQMPAQSILNGTPPSLHPFAPSLEGGLQIGGLSPGHPHPHAHGGSTNSGLFASSGLSGLDSGPNHHGNGNAQAAAGGIFGPVGSLGALGLGPGNFQVHGGRGDRTAGATLNLNSSGNDASSAMFENFVRPQSPPPGTVSGCAVAGASTASGNAGAFSGLGRTNSSPVVDNTQAYPRDNGDSSTFGSNWLFEKLSLFDSEEIPKFESSIMGPSLISTVWKF